MSYCKREGDHTSLFVTQEDLGKPEVVTSLAEDEEFGVILPNGEINWDCPCLGGLPSGPCGQEFKDAFSCFHYSTAEDKGSDCIEQFKAMQECFQKFPDLYKDYDDDDEDGGTEGKGESGGEKGSSGGMEDGGTEGKGESGGEKGSSGGMEDGGTEGKGESEGEKGSSGGMEDGGTEGKGESEGEKGSPGGMEDGGGKVEETGDNSEHTISASSDSKHQTSSSSSAS